MTNKKRAEQLGMSYGKAAHRLRQEILFSLVVATKRDTCIKCGGLIKKWDELSIDHILPWLDISNELFWDLNNIGFSHRKCNKADRPKGNRKIAKDGEAWCTNCQAFHSIEKFHKNPSHWNGLDNKCKICRSGKNHWRVIKQQRGAVVQRQETTVLETVQ